MFWECSAGGGAVLLVLEGSSHDTSNDVIQIFAPRYRWLLAKVCACFKLRFTVTEERCFLK